MKIIVGAATVLLLGAIGGSAGAAACASGPYRAGCAGPNGAVAVRKPVGYAAHPAPYAHTTVVAAPHATMVAAPHAVVVAPAPECRFVNGVRVCR